MINLEEKAQLMKEVGMTAKAEQILFEIEQKKVVEELTKMNFKPITEPEIRQMLCSEKYFKIDDEGVLYTVGLTLLAFALGAIPMLGCKNLALWPIPVTAAIICFTYTCIRFLWHLPELESMTLSNWRDNIPYGGLLAVKEAIGRGVVDFKIYYPCTERHKRLKTDPVITGIAGKVTEKRQCDGAPCFMIYFDASKHHTHESTVKAGHMVEVFAWDDGKVYD